MSHQNLTVAMTLSSEARPSRCAKILLTPKLKNWRLDSIGEINRIFLAWTLMIVFNFGPFSKDELTVTLDPAGAELLRSKISELLADPSHDQFADCLHCTERVFHDFSSRLKSSRRRCQKSSPPGSGNSSRPSPKRSTFRRSSPQIPTRTARPPPTTAHRNPGFPITKSS